MKLFVAVTFFLAVSTAWAQGSGVMCTAAADQAVRLRAGGQAELVSDVLVTCRGGAPAAAGAPVPQVTLTVTTSPVVPITSRVLNTANNASEAMLAVDEPLPSSQRPCAVSQAPCALTGTGDGVDTYGARNVFQGRQTAANTITWVGVPFDPPGSSGERVMRITNIRVAAPATAGEQRLTVTASTAGIPDANSILLSIVSPAPVVGTIEPGLLAVLRNGANTGALPAAGLSLQQCVPNNAGLHALPSSPAAPQGRSFVARYTERFNTVFKRRNAAQPVDAAPAGPGENWKGTDRFSATGVEPALPLPQSTLGFPYFTESGYYKPDFPATDGLFQAGLASSGTRLFLRVTAPAGVRVYAAVTVPLLTGDVQKGVAKMINATANGSGPFAATASTTGLDGGLAELAVAGSARQAIYEILTSDPATIEQVDIPVYLAFDGTTTASGTVVTTLGLAPVSADTTSGSGIVPRFAEVTAATTVAVIAPCGTQPVVEVTPASLTQGNAGAQYSQQFGATNATAPLAFRISAGALPQGLTLSAAGLLTGVPAQAGTSNFTVAVTDAMGRTASRAYTLIVAAALASLDVAPASLEFRAISNGPRPPSQIVLVSSQTAAVGVEVAATGGTWLRAAQAAGTTPFVVEVTVDPAGLAAADYTGAVEFRAANLTRRVGVTLRVSEALPPLLSADPPALTVSLPVSAQRTARLINLTNTGSSSATFTAAIEYEGAGGWLSVTPLSGTVDRGESLPLRLAWQGPALEPGIYRARIRITNTATSQAIVIPVTAGLTAGNAIHLSQTGLTFLAAAGGPAPRSQSFQVLSATTASFSWTAQTVVDPGMPGWLSLSRASGASGDTIDVSVNPSGLAAGDYLGEVRVEAQGVDNSPRFLFVSLKVLPAPPAASPDFDVAPAALLFVGTAGQASPAPQSLTVFNGGTAAASIEAQLQGQSRVFTVTPPANASLAPGGNAAIQVAANTAGLAAGIYRTTLTVRAAGQARAFAVDLLLIVTSTAPRTAASQPRTAEAVCPPGGLQIVSLRQAIGFSSATGLPLPVEVRVIGEDGTAMNGGAVTATLTGTSSRVLNLVQIPSDPARWSGTLQPPSQPAGAVSLKMLAVEGTTPRTGCLDLSGTFDASDAPVIADGGVLSASSFARGAPLASGGMAAIFGARLAAGTASASSLPLPVLLGQTRVTIGGRNMPLFFAGDQSTFTQVNGILPYGLTPTVSSQMTVRRGGLRSVTEVLISAAQPSVFTLDQSGSGQAIAVHGGDPTQLTDAANPASRGETIVIYAEGLGPVTPQVEAGNVSPVSPLARVSGVTVTIGGLPASVSFAGLTPGLSGLYQINAMVPNGVTAGSQVPVVVTVSGVSSPPVTIAVRP